jgi:rare lipoprotein A (peptidoglycan hydrolase)
MIKYSPFLLIFLWGVNASAETKYRRLDNYDNYATYSGDATYETSGKTATNNSKPASPKIATALKTSNYDGAYKIGAPYEIMGKTFYPHEDPNYMEFGVASWYGAEFHNRKTANGEIFDKNAYTAAHRTLPLPSIVKIINVENGKSIVVRVNDRGPFVDTSDRIIDVSEKVAKELDFVANGKARVRVEFLKNETEAFLRAHNLKY